MDGVVLVAAGASRRFGGSVSKVLRRVAGKPVLVRALGPFLVAVERFALVVVARPEDHPRIRRLLPRARLVEGGAARGESVRAGVAALPPDVRTILVHDAARPLVSADVVRRVLGAARRHGAAVPVVPVRDTLHRLVTATRDEPAWVREAVDRSLLGAAQTPQAARADLLRRALDEAGDELARATDEVTLLIRANVPVAAVRGDVRNLKITTSDDLALAERLLGEEPA